MEKVPCLYKGNFQFGVGQKEWKREKELKMYGGKINVKR